MQSTTSSQTAAAARAAAYRRLTLAMLGLDVPALAADLRAQRLGQDRPTPLVAPRPRRVAAAGQLPSAPVLGSVGALAPEPPQLPEKPGAAVRSLQAVNPPGSEQDEPGGGHPGCMDHRLPADAQLRCRRKLYGRSDRWGFALVAVAAVACLSVRWDPQPIDVQWLATLPNTVGLTMFAGHPMRRLQGFAAPLFSTNPDQPSCGAGQAIVYGMADLKARIGPAMGEPRDCEHPINADGDTVQLTTTGLATYTQPPQDGADLRGDQQTVHNGLPKQRADGEVLVTVQRVMVPAGSGESPLVAGGDACYQLEGLADREYSAAPGASERTNPHERKPGPPQGCQRV